MICPLACSSGYQLPNDAHVLSVECRDQTALTLVHSMLGRARTNWQQYALSLPVTGDESTVSETGLIAPNLVHGFSPRVRLTLRPEVFSPLIAAPSRIWKVSTRSIPSQVMISASLVSFQVPRRKPPA